MINKFIKVTNAFFVGYIYININHIRTINYSDNRKATIINIDDNYGLYIKETPEEIIDLINKVQ